MNLVGGSCLPPYSLVAHPVPPRPLQAHLHIVRCFEIVQAALIPSSDVKATAHARQLQVVLQVAILRGSTPVT